VLPVRKSLLRNTVLRSGAFSARRFSCSGRRSLPRRTFYGEVAWGAALTGLAAEADTLKGALKRQYSTDPYNTSKITAIRRHLALINCLIATVLQLMSVPSFVSCVFILERYWFFLHGTRPPRFALHLRPALG
jgi:hypothetical protein